MTLFGWWGRGREGGELGAFNLCHEARLALKHNQLTVSKCPYTKEFSLTSANNNNRHPATVLRSQDSKPWR